MSTNLEIEVKALISENDYTLLVNKYREKSYVQINYYVDSIKEPLKQEYGLRIRYKNDKYELTFKENFKDGKLETNQIISKESFLLMKRENIFPNGEVANHLKELNIDINDLKIIGELKTTRTDIKYKTSLISIDKNQYNSFIDFEIEAEDKSIEIANKNIVEFLTSNNIKFIQNKISKLERFKNSLMK